MRPVTSIDHAKRTARANSKLALSLDSLGVLPKGENQFFGDFAQRASERSSIVSEIKQQNIESIVELALDRSTATALAPPETDWLLEFIDLAEKSSNPRMQELWAKVLIAESMSPGSFSFRTLRLLSRITPYEAALLRKAKAITLLDQKIKRGKIVIGFEQRPAKWNVLQSITRCQLNIAKCGVNYPDILTLMDIGVLHSEAIESGTLQPRETHRFLFGGDIVDLTCLKPNVVLNFLKYTMIGEELCKLTKVEPSQKYWTSLERNMKDTFHLQRRSRSEMK